MDESLAAPPAPEKPTPPGRGPRLLWALVAVSVLALLLLCAALVLAAAWRGA